MFSDGVAPAATEQPGTPACLLCIGQVGGVSSPPEEVSVSMWAVNTQVEDLL